MNFGTQQQASVGTLATQTNYAADTRPGGPMQAPAPDTLLRALSQMESLNNRLSELSMNVEKIAIAIGGPWPCEAKQASGQAPTAQSPPAMVLLNGYVDAAHERVTMIEQALAAMRRSLGA